MFWVPHKVQYWLLTLAYSLQIKSIVFSCFQQTCSFLWFSHTTYSSEGWQHLREWLAHSIFVMEHLMMCIWCHASPRWLLKPWTKRSLFMTLSNCESTCADPDYSNHNITPRCSILNHTQLDIVWVSMDMLQPSAINYHSDCWYVIRFVVTVVTGINEILSLFSSSF